MVSAGDGVQQKLDERHGRRRQELDRGAARRPFHSGVVTDTTPLTRDDAALIRKLAGPFLKGVAEIRLTRQVAASHAADWPTVLNGTVADHPIVRNWNPAAGRFFTPRRPRRPPTSASSARPCAKLFPDDANPLGQTIRIDRLRLRIVGVLSAKGRTPTGSDQDDEIFTPITTLQRKLVGEDHLSTILAAAQSESLLEQARQRCPASCGSRTASRKGWRTST